MSSCSHLGYNHTTQSLASQRILDIVLKRRLGNFGNHSLCSSLLQKIFCAEFAPPCFPEDETEIVLRTVCKSDCESMQKECPELYREHFGVNSYCEQMATEKSDLDGFCKLTKWPTAGRWPSEPNTTGKLWLMPHQIPTISIINNSPKFFLINQSPGTSASCCRSDWHNHYGCPSPLRGTLIHLNSSPPSSSNSLDFLYGSIPG